MIVRASPETLNHLPLKGIWEPEQASVKSVSLVSVLCVTCWLASLVSFSRLIFLIITFCFARLCSPETCHKRSVLHELRNRDFYHRIFLSPDHKLGNVLWRFMEFIVSCYSMTPFLFVLPPSVENVVSFPSPCFTHVLPPSFLSLVSRWKTRAVLAYTMHTSRTRCSILWQLELMSYSPATEPGAGTRSKEGEAGGCLPLVVCYRRWHSTVRTSRA